MKLLNVCGARPNYMKVAALMQAYARRPGLDARLLHTGQHYDHDMSTVFFDELGLPRPDVNLGVGSGPHGRQTAAIMRRFEGVLRDERPDAVVVVGDVNSTLACALVGRQMHIPVVHVEAGLRSFDRSMPEELNRCLTDAISTLLLASEAGAVANLRREGADAGAVHLVGNVMIDTLQQHLPRARDSKVHRRLEVQPRRYAAVTLHRPANVDDPEIFGGIVDVLEQLQRDQPVVFCMHPRTRRQAETCGLLERLQSLPDVRLTAPLGYLEFLHLQADAAVILTDSGGIQEEATILGVPCLTLRDNTERPVTLTHGTNRLAGCTPQSILQACRDLDELRHRSAGPPPLWDGHAADRIADLLLNTFS